MIIKYPKEFKIFIALYFPTMFILLGDCVDTFPMGSVLRKIKYLYIILMFAIVVYKGYITRKQMIACLPILFLVIHTVVFGIFITNETVIVATRSHMKECLMFYMFVLVTFWYVANTHCFLLFAELSYLALLFQLGFAAITHFNNFVNPIYYVNAFDESSRFRMTFGFVQYGYTGNYAFCALAVSMILLHSFRGKREYRRAVIAILVCDFPVLCMAFSAASRSSIIALILTVFFYCFFIYFNTRKKVWHKVVQTLLLVGILTFFIAYCIINGTRDLNIDGNLDAFHKVGNFWTGMGMVENHGFQEGTCIYGVKTTSLDVSYVYYYFTTGVVGCTLIVLAALSFLYNIVKNKYNKYRYIVLAIFIAMLFFAYWQVNLFTYTYFSNYIYFVLYLVAGTEAFVPPGKEPLVEFIV